MDEGATKKRKQAQSASHPENYMGQEAMIDLRNTSKYGVLARLQKMCIRLAKCGITNPNEPTRLRMIQLLGWAGGDYDWSQDKTFDFMDEI